jgi:hypothetical protein
MEGIPVGTEANAPSSVLFKLKKRRVTIDGSSAGVVGVGPRA